VIETIKQTISACLGALVFALLFGPFVSHPEATYVAVPQHAVMAFNLAACPAGWAEYTAARGRPIIGLPSGGTLEGAVGTPFTNVQAREVGVLLSSGTPQVGGFGFDGTAIEYNIAGVFYHDTAATFSTTPPAPVNQVYSVKTIDTTPFIQLLYCQKS
jgi:hypothetical protein